MHKRLRESSESTSDNELQDNPVFSTEPSGSPIKFTHIIGQPTKKSAIDDLYDLLNEENSPNNLGY